MKLLIKTIAFSLLLSGLCLAADFVVIVNPANTASSISNAELKRIFTGKMTQFGGQKVVPINLADSDPLYTAFASSIIKMSSAEFKQFWVDAQVKGEGTAPMVQRNSGAAKMIVGAIPGAIAYVDASVVDGSVKKIDIK